MFSTGEKIQFCNANAIILTFNDDEVLLFFENGYTKWIELSLLQLMKAN